MLYRQQGNNGMGKNKEMAIESHNIQVAYLTLIINIATNTSSCTCYYNFNYFPTYDVC